MLKKLVSLLFVIFSICLFKSTANAAIAFVSGSNATPCQSGGATSCTLTLGTINNGNLIIFDGITAAGPLGTLPSGGSSPVVCPSNHGSYFHCYKVWFTGDPTTYAFANASGSGGWLIGAAAWSGEDQTTPIDEYAEAVAGGANGSTIYLPALGGHYDGEMRIADCLSYNGGTMITPTGMTVRESGTSGGQDYAFIYDLTGGPLSNTTPVPTLTCGNPGGSSFHDSGMTWLIKPAGAVTDTYNPVAGLACYGWSNHVNDTMDMTNCNLQNGDLVETCTEGFLNSGSYGNLPALVPPAKFTASIARDYFYSQIYNSRCTYGYWHTGDPQTFTWGWDGQIVPSTGNVSGATNYIVHRVPSGTAYIGPANQPAPTFSSATTISQAITTTQPYSTLLLNIQSNGSANGFSSSPSGSFLINNGMNIADADQATFQLDAYTNGSQGTKTFVFNSGTPDSNIYSWIVTATNPFAGLGYVSSSICSNQVNTNSISCTPPSGTSGDILLAPVLELSDPGQSTLNALAPAGWTLLKYQNDTSQGLVGVTVPDTSTVFLGTLQQDLATSIQVLPSGTAAYTIHGCAQTPVSWGGGGGLLGVNNNFNGTNDTLDRALRMNSSGQWMFSHGATSSLLSGATTLTSPLTYNDGHSHCVAGTFDGTNMNLYVDGSLVAGPTAPSTANVTLPTTGYWVGGYTKQPGFFYGAPFVVGQLAVWNGTALSGAQVASLAAHTTDGFFDSTMSSLSPSYWWKLNETAPNQPAVDSGSGGNTGIYYQFRGILNQTSVGGMGDKSPYFGGSFLNGNGGSPQVQMGNQVTWNGTNFSWEAFIKTPVGAVGGLVGLNDSQNGSNSGNSNGQYPLYVDTNGKIAFGILDTSGGGGHGVASVANVNDGALHLVDGTWDGTTLKVYLDGTAASSTPGASTHGNTPSYPVIGLGSASNLVPNDPTQNAGNGLFNAGAVPGVYGRVSMWNGVTLTPTQITNHNAHKNDGNYDTVILADSPTSYWKLNETNGAATAIDYGSAGNNGTYTNMQIMAWALWEKTRAASESAVAFPLGNNAVAQGTIIDASNVFNTIDGSNFFDNSGLNNSSYVFGQSITPANDFELNLLGSNGGSCPPSGCAIPPSGTPGIATLQNINFGTYGFTGPTVPDNGFTFDGVTDYGYTATSQTNYLTSAETSLIAFKTTTTKGGILFELDGNQNGTATTWVPLIWMDNAGHLTCSYYAGSASGASSTTTYNDGNPHIAACTSPGGTGTLTLYVDGVSKGTASVSGTSGFSAYFRMGSNPQATSVMGSGAGSFNPSSYTINSFYFKGTLGQAAIWKGTVLTQPQIASLTTHISDGTFDATLLALTPSYWWKMADAASTQPTVVESVAGTNTGTFVGNAVVAYVGASPYQGTFSDIGGVMYSSGTWNLGMNLLMPEGVPPPISGGKILIFIGQ